MRRQPSQHVCSGSAAESLAASATRPRVRQGSCRPSGFLHEARPRLLVDEAQQAIYLTRYGRPFAASTLSLKISAYVRAAELAKPWQLSCLSPFDGHGHAGQR